MATGPLRIKLRCASWRQLATIYKRDLSNGTMLLRATVLELAGVIERHVSDPERGSGVEIMLAPMAAGAIWMIESALAAEQAPLPAAPPKDPTGPVPSLADGADMAAAEVELSRALVAEAESLKKLNPFLVLGIGYEAGDAEVRQAFGELTKRYHPDRFARYESSELRRVASEIFILIRDAYRKLADEAGRSAVLAQLGRSRGAGPQRAAPTWTEARWPAAHIPPPLPKTVPLRTVTVPAPPPPPAAASTASPAPTPPTAPEPGELAALDELIDEARLDEALSGFRVLARRHPHDRPSRAGIELCEGLLALKLRDRIRAAQRFESALEIDPNNERAAFELADMRRQATEERRGLLSRLMGRPEGT